MTTCSERVVHSVNRVYLSRKFINLCVYFLLFRSFEGLIWDVIIVVLEHRLSFYW